MNSTTRHLTQLNGKQIETCFIAIVWIVILLWPLGTAYFIDSSNSEPIDTRLLGVTYKYLVSFLVLFLLHNYVVMPYIYTRQKTWLNILSVVVLLGSFAIFLKTSQPEQHFGHEHHEVQPFDPEYPEAQLFDYEYMEEESLQPFEHDRPEKRHFHEWNENSWLLSPPDMARMVIAILMIIANIGIGAVLKESEQRKRLLQLEQQNLKQELDNLKHQINPHFFMNTLNNIHALIDIDQELAKRSLVELSQFMRYMLYEGTGPTVALNREIEYIERYISLMKLRYDEKVEIFCQFNRENATLQIPPLLLVTFVENAFKHGVSYREHSFIYVNLDVIDDGQYLHFSCTNSRHDIAPTQDKGGIGLENVRKRLNLLYGDKYRLEVDTHDRTQFVVNLILPTKTSTSCPSAV